MLAHLVISKTIDKLLDDSLVDFYSREGVVSPWTQLQECMSKSGCILSRMLDLGSELRAEILRVMFWAESTTQYLHQHFIVI